MKKKNTLDSRLAAADTELTSTLGVFENVARRLDAATETHQALAAEANAEAERLLQIAAVANERVAKAQAAAQNVRNLLG